jgi:pyridoxal phosphate enzyme (YggS family)
MLRENLAHIRQRIEASARRMDRDLSEVTLVAVTKGVDTTCIREAIDAGVRHIGENRIQEALLKYDGLNDAARAAGASLTWHMIGHLQTNKVRDAVRIFDLIHSVDSLRLAVEIDKEAGKIKKVQDVLLEVKTSPEATKYGFSPEDVSQAYEQMKDFNNMRIKGLMTIAPQADVSEKARSYFRKLRRLGEELNRLSSIVPTLSVGRHRPFALSMGMTDDFEVAVEEGATHVRIGRGIFGER